MQHGRLFLFLLISTLLFLLRATSFSVVVGATALTVVEATCGTTIPADSQWMVGPAWAFQRPALGARSLPTPLAGSELRFGRASLGSEIEEIIHSEAGMNPNMVVIFELNPHFHAANKCKFLWNPLEAAIDGTETTAARVFALAVTGINASCQTPSQIEVTLQYNQEVSYFIPVDVGKSTTYSLSFSTRDMRWPVLFHVSPNCVVYLLLLTNRQGSIHKWYAWIPATIVTVMVLLLVTTMMLFWRELPPAATAMLLTLLFVGYLGSCIGLVMEVLSWQSVLGRVFPFPDAVTLYCCLPIFYLLMFLLVLLRNRYSGVLFHALLRLAVYGLNLALCCGYWVAGDVLLGSLTLLQFLLSNLFLSAAYSYFAVILGRAQLRVEPISGALGFLWFAPLTPFAPCLLMYYDLYIMQASSQAPGALTSILQKAVVMYDTMTSFPLLLLQNVWGIAMLATVTSYHMPFLILLFTALLFFTLQSVVSIGQYAKLRRRWIRRGDITERRGCFVFFCDWFRLWGSLERCIRGDNCQRPAEPETRRVCHLMATMSADGPDGASPEASVWQARE
ncbi:hypothetical protein TraAM80_03165 [Trypanosoma rangeli]|uniref:Uncharacterized protein n=1 Tax=Trypanosoma rangeli TaxID=5698 RepID=A0A3R7NUA8_TRYRA|nr:uncharacterized protein TraAM80_03165 [Trypanosoma rangeli]RNF07791.1 hypothetical protein TraAM80_03165 [Trypanosoma rangeli]|eukprot:RNF07791.1 hypothetical protein TraAM80_03165 [Trypanosoma rangeli]